MPWGKYQNAYKLGTKARVKQENYIKAKRPDLKIIPMALWNQVQARLKQVRESCVRGTDGNLWGRPSTAKYLLSGPELTRCGVCGGSMLVQRRVSGSPGKRKAMLTYVCSRHYLRGKIVCRNAHRMRMEDADREVIGTIESTVIGPNADWLIQ